MTFDDPEGMLHLRAESGLKHLELDEGLVLARVLFERTDLARPLGDKPVALTPVSSSRFSEPR
ncbi:hypothetical protein D3C85_1217220 [compost metagenome]